MKRYRLLLLPLATLALTACLSIKPSSTATTLDDLDGRPFRIDSDSRIDSSRQQAMQQYREFIEAHPGSPLQAEALRRLADLQLADDDTPAADGPPAQTAPTDETSGAAASIRIYEDLLATYPDQPGNDQVLYQLARAYDDDGQMAKALATLGKLVNDYPDSRFFAEAHFRRAEMYFLAADYEAAEAAYAEVLKLPEKTPFHQQALYKSGWSQFKQEAYTTALATFFTILDRRLLATGDGPPDNDAALIDETLRVVSLGFSYLAGEVAIDDYFREHGERPYAHRVYQALADLYLEKDRLHDAARILQTFSQRHPLQHVAPAFLIRAIAIYRQGGFSEQVLAAMSEFVDRYELDSPYWQRFTEADETTTIAYLEQTLHTLARHFHAQAQKDRLPAAYDTAIQWYRRYLANFPARPASARQHFLLAETLFEAGRYRQAVRAYERTAYDYPSHDDGARAAFAALTAYQRQAATIKDPAEAAIWQRRHLASILRFADRYPRHPQAATALTKAAEDYFRLSEAETATIVARRLLALQPRAADGLRRSAWLVIGHGAFDAGRYTEAETAYQQSLRLMPAGFHQRPAIIERLASSIYKQGETLRDAGEPAAAAEQFLRVAVAAPASTILATAEFDAATLLLTLRQWPRAIAVLKAFRQRFPDHALQQDIPLKLATAYLEDGQPLAAAAEFERVARSGEDIPLRQETLWRAAGLYRDGNEPSKAAAAYKRYLVTFPDDFERGIEARQTLADLNLGVGNQRRYHYWLQALIDADRHAGKKRSDRSRTLAARASLTLAQPLFERFRQVRLKLPLARSLKRKKGLMEKTLKAYQQAAAYGIAEITTAATFAIGEIYRDFSVALMKSARPAGLSADELDEYDLLLEDQAFPFEEQAIEIHEANADRVVTGLYDQWIRKSFAVLAEMLPVRYAKPERSEDVVDILD